MKKYEYILCILSFITLLFIIEYNKYQELNVFNNNFLLTETIKEELEVETEMETQNNKEIYKEEITSLKKEYQNDDVVATLEILNTDYKVPVVQGVDNDYYLNHLPNKEYSIMGSIFLDYRVNIDNSKKLLIFGHNSSTYNMPFDILENYYDKSYLDNHKYIEIKTVKSIKKYEIFSVFIETKDFSYMKVDFTSTSYLDHINNLKNKSMYDLDINLQEDSNILILQTCSTHENYLKYKKKYLIIALKEIEVITNLVN